MPRAPGSELEDSYQRLMVPDFSAGEVTYMGALSLPLNAASALLNLVPYPGRLKYRGGYAQYSPLSYTADQALAFYDTNGDKHFPVWMNGGLYDVVAGVAVPVELLVYTPGERVGATYLNGILYWSTETVPLRYWNPATGIFGAVVQTGVSPPPASPYLFTYTNAIVALGVKYGAAAYQPTVMGWSIVNDPGNWDASDAQAVGPLTEATLQFGVLFGIANTGIPPTRTFLVGRSDGGIYSYSGALNALVENVINCPVGCRDGASAQYVPGSNNFGQVIFLGNDAQFWATDGINAFPISLPILDLVSSQANYAGFDDPTVRYWAGYNEKFQYYFCNVGQLQFCYRWDIKAWSHFIGWPNGPIVYGTAATDDNGIPAVYIASNDALNKGYFRIALAGTGDKNVAPNMYYVSPWLHAGDPELVKIWHWISVFANNVGTVYKVTVRGLARANDGSFMQTDPIYLQTAPPGASGDFILDVSLLDGPGVLAAQTLAEPTAPVSMHGRLACPFVPEADSMLIGLNDLFEDLKATAIQVKIEYSSGTIDFDLLGLQLRYLPRGYRRESGNEYDGEMGVADPHDPFVPPLVPIDAEQSS